MGLFYPVTSEHICLSLTRRSVVHASAVRPFRAADEFRQRGAVRALCGVDALPTWHGVAGHPGDAVVATWPPPVIDRCLDCARITGVGGRQRKGSRYWQDLVDPGHGEASPSDGGGS